MLDDTTKEEMLELLTDEEKTELDLFNMYLEEISDGAISRVPMEVIDKFIAGVSKIENSTNKWHFSSQILKLICENEKFKKLFIDECKKYDIDFNLVVNATMKLLEHLDIKTEEYKKSLN